MTSPFKPPSGLGDLEFQSNAHDDWETVEVGTLALRVKPPAASALFALVSATSDSPDGITAFLCAQMSPESYERVMETMMDPDRNFTVKDLGAVVRAIATIGTARPYRAVASLAHAAVHNWRSIRARLILSGIADPLTMLPDMHAILDVTEALITENMESAKVDELHFQLYQPELGDNPEDFDEDAQMAAFEAFEAAMGKIE